MSGDGAPEITVDAAGLTVEIVASSWHTEIMDGLVNGAVRAAEASGAGYRVTRVAGAVELTVVAEALARRGADAIACLGVVIRGGTPHFEYVCQSVTQGLTDVSREHAVPVGFGVLTVDTVEQALNRAGLPDSDEDKGAEAVEAALQTALTLRAL
ncbi:6,7-dimethyl-8-ribityllumazine synthase [Demequina salsinemoris]|uniref:6,7-dimethyl-8-ribityllumazine synthase n=1 Tax=Demequina salsinemoris TaxID=577470 RepID=UPI000783E460|nr:6,7-dimethyl-8-ribityllumazine synthase [Demequina salsinemoris]